GPRGRLRRPARMPGRERGRAARADRLRSAQADPLARRARERPQEVPRPLRAGALRRARRRTGGGLLLLGRAGARGLPWAPVPRRPAPRARAAPPGGAGGRAGSPAAPGLPALALPQGRPRGARPLSAWSKEQRSVIVRTARARHPVSLPNGTDGADFPG